MRSGLQEVWLLGTSLFLVTACAPPLRGRPFDNSSIDFNGANLHRMRTPGEIETVADAVVSIMESSGASLMKRRSPSEGSVLLSFRVAVDRVVASRSSNSGSYYSAPSRWFRAGMFGARTTTTIDYVAYGAVFYVELSPVRGGIEIQALGLPVVDGVTSCPGAASLYRDCRPAPSKNEAGFADNVRGRAGISVSGAKEAEVLDGLWAQLRRKRWQDAFRASMPPTESVDTGGIDDAFAAPVPNQEEE